MTRLQNNAQMHGDRIQVDLLPDGKAEVRPAAGRSSIQALHGLLKGKTNGKRLSIDEINEAIATAGAAAGMGKR